MDGYVTVSNTSGFKSGDEIIIHGSYRQYKWLDKILYRLGFRNFVTKKHGRTYIIGDVSQTTLTIKGMV